MSESALRIGMVFPELLGTYGDRGNALVLADRARRRGIPATVMEILADDPIPESLDAYLIGGGEDDAQYLALDRMRRSAALTRAHRRGAQILAICAGFQLMGTTMAATDGRVIEGLGLVDAATRPGATRTVGELLVDTVLTGVGTLTGFENHRGVTDLGPGVRPLGRGTGASGGVHPEGCVAGGLIGTYLHGPALARNPQLADHMLAAIVGELPPIADDDLAILLHAERVSSARTAQADGKRGRAVARLAG